MLKKILPKSYYFIRRVAVKFAELELDRNREYGKYQERLSLFCWGYFHFLGEPWFTFSKTKNDGADYIKEVE